MNVELHGDEHCVMYRLRFHGGPWDGRVVNSPRPYDGMKGDGHQYRAECEGERCLVWVDDWTRDINLYHAGACAPTEPHPSC